MAEDGTVKKAAPMAKRREGIRKQWEITMCMERNLPLMGCKDLSARIEMWKISADLALFRFS